MQRLVHPGCQGGREPPGLALTVLKPGFAVARVAEPSAEPMTLPIVQTLFDDRLMDNFPEKDRLRAMGSFAGHRHPGGFAAGVELDAEGLQHRFCDRAILQTDREGRDNMHDGPPACEQQSRSLFGARHQRLFVPIQHKDSHNNTHFPYGTRSASSRKSLLAKVQSACSVRHTARATPSWRLMTDDRA